MPTLVLLAGPNGAGKTTFINGFLRERAEAFEFVNPDEVARGLIGGGAARDLAAGRRVLERLDELVAGRADFVLETTLASRSHAVRIVSASGKLPATGSN
jgi:predicted ABC-type ATPase